MLLKVALLLVALTAVSAQQRVQLTPCTNGVQLPEYFESDMCTPTVCNLPRGRVFTGSVHVIPREPFSVLTVNLVAMLGIFPFDLTIPPGYENACNFLERGGTCPVQVGGLYWWGLQFPVAATTPLVSGLRLTVSAGEGGRQVACATISANIVA